MKNNTKISIIVAVDEKNGIGKNGKMPWHIPDELGHFKRITTGHPVIMGRKTFDSLKKPFLNRTNIVISRNLSMSDINQEEDRKVIISRSLEEAIEEAKKAFGNEEIFIIGGGEIFKEAINIADKIYLTKIQGDYKADTFFPDYSQFKRVVFEKEEESSGYKYKFIDLEKS